MQFLLIFNSILALAEKLLPVVSEQMKTGEIPTSEQQEARDRYTALRTKADTLFDGPQWKPSQGTDGQV